MWKTCASAYSFQSIKHVAAVECTQPCRYCTGEELQLMFTSNIRMATNHFDCNMIVAELIILRVSGHKSRGSTQGGEKKTGVLC